MFISISLHRKVCNYFFFIQYLTYHSAVKLSYIFMKKGKKRKPQRIYILTVSSVNKKFSPEWLSTSVSQVELSQMSIKVWGYTHSCVLWPNLDMILKERWCTIHFDAPACFKQDVMCVILVCPFHVHSYKLLKNCLNQILFFEIQLKYRKFKSLQFPVKIMQLETITAWNKALKFSLKQIDKIETTAIIFKQVRPNDVWTCVACSYFIYKKLT